MRTIAEFFAHVDAIQAAAPRLSDAEQATYDRICKRLHRAETDRRRAERRGDATKVAAAERSLTRAREDRAAILAPHVDHRWAPPRILSSCAMPWSGPSGSGIHHQTYEMVLDHKDLSGPSYRTVRVLKDEGGPPTNARSAPTRMGVAWHAIADQIDRGKIVVLDQEEPS